MTIAARHFEEGRIADAAAVCERLAHRHAHQASLQALTARIALEREQYGAAIKILEPLIAADDAPLEDRLRLARAYIEVKLYTQAEQLLAATARLAPDAASVQGALAHLWLHTHQPARALGPATAAADAAPTNVDAQLLLCDALYRTGAVALARQRLTELAECQEPCSARLWMAQADMAEKLELVAVAQRAWRAAHRHDPTRQKAFFQTGCASYARRDFAQAAHCFRKASRLDPHDRSVTNSLISALARLSSSDIDADLEREVAVCLRNERVDPHHLRAVAIDQLLSKPALQRLVNASHTA
ncbi:MAG: tetratricopeptide repeat protein [Gammaproteobacteria bacterium]